MKYLPRFGDEIYIAGYDEVFIVELVQEQYKYSMSTKKIEYIFSVIGKETGARFEIDENMIESKRTEQVIKRKIDELLDYYNYCLAMEQILKDGEYANKANIVMHKLKDEIY